MALAIIISIGAAASSNWDNAHSSSTYNGYNYSWKFSLKKIYQNVKTANSNINRCYKFNEADPLNGSRAIFETMTKSRNSVMALIVFTIILAILGVGLGIFLLFKEIHRFAKYGVVFLFALATLLSLISIITFAHNHSANSNDAPFRSRYKNYKYGPGYTADVFAFIFALLSLIGVVGKLFIREQVTIEI